MSSSSATARRGRTPRGIALAAVWLGGGLLLLLLLEAGVRIVLPDVNAQGADRALVRPFAFGATHGWTPGASGTVFGEPVTIDADGFRNHHPPADADSLLLLFGDSVTFGVGVPADSTFAGRLQHVFPRRRIVNTGALGYSVQDYRAVASAVLSRPHPVAAAVIICSLNDFPADPAPEVRAAPGLGFLREHSRLYLVLKNILFDRSRAYFLHDLGYYTRSAPGTTRALEDLRTLVREVAARGIPVTVLLLPYEYQVRRPLPGNLLPQRMITAALAGAPCTLLDLTPEFLRARSPARLFLYGDHMHLSAAGHGLAATGLAVVLARSVP